LTEIALEDAVAHTRTLKVYRLVQAGNPPETTLLDATGREEWDTLPYYDLTFFQDIWNLIQNDPIREGDKATLGLLREIGIEKGKPFEPTGEWADVYNDGARRAFDYLQDVLFTPGALLVPHDGDDNQGLHP
jgi:hypothetical protein